MDDGPKQLPEAECQVSEGNPPSILIGFSEQSFSYVILPIQDPQVEPDELVILNLRDDVGDYLVDVIADSDTVLIEDYPEWLFGNGFEDLF